MMTMLMTLMTYSTRRCCDCPARCRTTWRCRESTNLSTSSSSTHVSTQVSYSGPVWI